MPDAVDQGEARRFIARQAQLEAKIAEWQAAAPETLRVDHVTSYAGLKVYGLTLSDWRAPREGKRAQYIAQPHAHEPGATAGMVDVIEQLVTGRDLDGRPTSLDVDRLLSLAVITFNPIGNPQGREAAPVLWWDGSRYTNDEFWCWMRGEDPDHPGQMWERYDIWDRREVRAPEPVGIVYEQIDAHRYVEPNRSRLSSYFCLFALLDAAHGYERWLDLHQTEFVQSEDTCEVLLPLEGLTQGRIAEENLAWAAGSRPAGRRGWRAPRAPADAYTGTQAAYLQAAWADLYQRLSHVTVEVKNNATGGDAAVPAPMQALAIEASLEMLLEKRRVVVRLLHHALTSTTNAG